MFASILRCEYFEFWTMLRVLRDNRRHSTFFEFNVRKLFFVFGKKVNVFTILVTPGVTTWLEI